MEDRAGEQVYLGVLYECFGTEIKYTLSDCVLVAAASPGSGPVLDAYRKISPIFIQSGKVNYWSDTEIFNIPKFQYKVFNCRLQGGKR